MNRKIPWFDMIGFYLLLPVAFGGVCYAFFVIWQEGSWWAYFVHLIFWCFTILLLCSSIGVFIVKLVKGIWAVILKALHETWNEMVDSMIEASNKR